MKLNTANTATVMPLDEAAFALTDPLAYADGRLDRACAVLRRESPVHWVEAPGFRPFFALTKYDDIVRAEQNSGLFIAEPRYRLRSIDQELIPNQPRTLVRIDPPLHTQYRELMASRFRRTALRPTENPVRELARAAVDAMTAHDDTYDFVTEVAMRYPAAIICSLLGFGSDGRDLILEVTRQSFGSEDPQYRGSDPDRRGDFAAYVQRIGAARRQRPVDDISSVLANAVVDGEPLPSRDLVGYLGMLATAGHDTTSSTIAGGLQALIEHPDQLGLLRDDLTLIPRAVDEMLRWTTPGKSFMRVATADTEIRGQRIAAGEAVLLLYPSANRDEDVFEDPDRFDVRRTPNRHLSFGHGIHYCLGTHLAKLEIQSFFAELLPRLGDVSIDGTPEMVRTLFVGGLKYLPIRAEVR